MPKKKKVIILGAGASGLSAGWFISELADYAVSIYEKTASLGGICGSFKYNDFNLDYGPHKIYSIIPGIMNLLEGLCQDKLVRVKKQHRIILKGKLINYPIQLKDLPKVFRPWDMVQCAFSVLIAGVNFFSPNNPHSYKDYIINKFGRKLYDFVFEPVAEKTWGSPETLSADVALTRIPTKGVFDLIMRTLGFIKENNETQAEYFLYPKEGFSGIIKCLAEKINKNGSFFYMEKFPTQINISKVHIKSIIFNDGSEVGPDLVVSSIPVNDLSALLFPKDISFQKEVSLLEMMNFTLVYFFVNRSRVLDVQWIFCPDKDLFFNRLSEQKLMSNEIGPSERTVICCDFMCAEDDWKWRAEPAELAARCIADLEKLKLLRKSEIYDYLVIKIPRFYPRYSFNYGETMAKVFGRIKSIKNLICTGRSGLYNYNNFDHCIEMGRIIANGLNQNKSCSDIIDELIERSASYRIVD